MPFPQGEAREQFIKRTVSAFNRLIFGLRDDAAFCNAELVAAFVVHGGSIMALLSAYNCGGYFDFQCANGEGFVCEIERRTSDVADGTAENAAPKFVFASCRSL